MIWLHVQNDFCILNYHDININIYNFRTNEVKFAWIGDFCIFNYHDIYIYTYNFRINDMKFAWISCISDHFCILEYDDIYTDSFFRTNDMKIAYIWLHFRSFVYLTKYWYMYIYISEQITWNLYELVACQIMFVSYKKWYIYIYIFNIRTTHNMPCLGIWVPPICLVSRFRGSITHAFPQMGVVLISKAN